MEQSKRDESPIHLPENPAVYLTDWLFEIGPSSTNGMGESPIGWQEMAAWQNLAGIRLMPWEARLLRKLSGDFIAARYKAKEPLCPAPFDPIAEDKAALEKRQETQARALFAGFAALAAKPNKKPKSATN